VIINLITNKQNADPRTVSCDCLYEWLFVKIYKQCFLHIFGAIHFPLCLISILQLISFKSYSTLYIAGSDKN